MVEIRVDTIYVTIAIVRTALSYPHLHHYVTMS